MHISVVGIGYVGAVTAACAARDGHSVIAVDVHPAKVAEINAGRSPVSEPGLGELVAAAVANGRLRATADIGAAIAASELSFVCVGTPSRPDGSIDLSHVARVAERIGPALSGDGNHRSVVLRSTVLPGTTEGLFVRGLEAASGRRIGEEFGVGYYPEFLREGTAIQDYDNPGAIVFGRIDDKSVGRLHAMQSRFPVTPFVVPTRTAEAVKCFNNAWHATKVSFANEAGAICKAFGVDSHEMMDVLCSDMRLNVSRSYMRPGFAFGGSCLPKDVRALRRGARQADVATPLLDGVMGSNDLRIEAAIRLVRQAGGRRVGLIGLSFKPDTDDLRESPLAVLAERLLAAGFEVAIFDDGVRLAALTGANLEYAEARLPGIEAMMRERLADLVADSDTLVVGHPAPMTSIEPDQIAGKSIVDLVRYARDRRSGDGYAGLCW